MIPAIALTAHADHRAEGVESPANIIAGALIATIGVKQRPARWRFLRTSIAQRVEH
jgi:hypothetical protein